jgi:hypothetical protein
MIGEIDIGGVFVPTLLLWALLALAISALVRKVLSMVGAYRFVWHPALFDMALFVIVWAGLPALAARFGSGPLP